MDQNQELTIDNIDNGTYVAIPKIIFNSDKLNSTEKILCSVILGLSRNQYKECTATIKYFAKLLNLSTRIIQMYIINLEFKGFIKIRKKGNKRFFTPTYWDKDAYALITSDILNSNKLSSCYKLTYGRLVARGWNNDQGGYNYDSMDDLASDFNLSVASAYRHIQLFKSQSLIARDKDATMRFIPNNKYSINNQRQLKAKQAESERLKELAKSIPITDKADQVIDDIFKRIK